MTERPGSRVRLCASSMARLAAVTAILSATLAILSVATPASARTPKYSGAAPGTVSCSVSAKVSFSPPLTLTGGGTNPSTVTAKLTKCLTGLGSSVDHQERQGHRVVRHKPFELCDAGLRPKQIPYAHD